jgi:hypothetical protein
LHYFNYYFDSVNKINNFLGIFENINKEKPIDFETLLELPYNEVSEFFNFDFYEFFNQFDDDGELRMGDIYDETHEDIFLPFDLEEDFEFFLIIKFF